MPFDTPSPCEKSAESMGMTIKGPQIYSEVSNKPRVWAKVYKKNLAEPRTPGVAARANLCSEPNVQECGLPIYSAVGPESRAPNLNLAAGGSKTDGITCYEHPVC